jgi:hypothetical protein
MDTTGHLDDLVAPLDDVEEGAPPPKRRFSPVLAVGPKRSRAELEAMYGGRQSVPNIEFVDEDVAAGWE